MANATKTTPTTTELRKSLGEIERRRDELLEELGGIMREADPARAKNIALPKEMERRARALPLELKAAQLDLKIAKQEWRSRRRAEIEAHPAYRDLVVEVANEFASMCDSTVEYALTVRREARKGIALMPLPPFAQQQVDDLCRWLRELDRRGLGVDREELLPPLRELLELGE